MSYFFYVHQEDAEVTVKVVLPSTPVSIRYIMDKVMADPASSSIRTSSWIVSLDGSKPIVNEQDLLKIGPNSDVFLLPKPKEPSAEDAAVAAPVHSAGGKALEVYFHVFNTEEDDDPMITTRRPFDPTWERDAVLASILTASAAQSLKRGGSDVTVKYLAQKGQPLTIWASGEKLSTYPVNGDVMIFGNKPKVVAQRPPSASTASTSPAVPPPSAANDESRRASMELRAKCDELESQRKFAAVAALLNEAIAAAPSDEGKRLMRSELARMWLERAKVPERALPVLDSLVQEVEDKIPVEHVKLLIAKGHAHFDQKKWKAASDAFSRACTEAETHGIKLPLDIAKDVRLYLGASFFAQGYDEGIKIIQETLEGDVNNTFGVMWMSKAYAAKGHPEDALQWAVQLVVRDQKNEELKANFAEICSKVPKPVQIIKTKVLNASPGADRAMAWGFLGQVARDHGQLALSRDLYQEALNLKPTSANIALNHAHVFEQMGNSLECLKHLCMFINRNSNQSMNGMAQASKILPLVQDGLRAALTGERKMHTELLRLTEDEEILVLEPTEENKAIKPGHSNGWDPNSSSRELGLVGERLFTEEELSLAGIYFTVVKVLYTMGCLHKIPPIVKIIEEARRNEKMSRTNMKNEHAYYTTICESMQWLNHERENPDELLAKSADVRSQLFVCGDSHSLPLSWQKLTLDGAEVVTVNKLVTGLKIWHLRDECTFFPRFNFDAVAMSIPEGADVLFCFGEIDCREGILRAVEKGVYDNHKDAMVKLMEIYVTRLMKLRKERKLRRVFVHAAFPILDLTRHVVCAFNQVFTAVFNHVPGFHCINNTDDILTLPTSESGQPSELAKASGELRVVKPQFTLDHTHINPQYVKELLEGSLTASVRSKPAVEFA